MTYTFDPNGVRCPSFFYLEILFFNEKPKTTISVNNYECREPLELLDVPTKFKKNYKFYMDKGGSWMPNKKDLVVGCCDQEYTIRDVLSNATNKHMSQDYINAYLHAIPHYVDAPEIETLYDHTKIGKPETDAVLFDAFFFDELVEESDEYMDYELYNFEKEYSKHFSPCYLNGKRPSDYDRLIFPFHKSKVNMGVIVLYPKRHIIEGYDPYKYSTVYYARAILRWYFDYEMFAAYKFQTHIQFLEEHFPYTQENYGWVFNEIEFPDMEKVEDSPIIISYIVRCLYRNKRIGSKPLSKEDILILQRQIHATMVHTRFFDDKTEKFKKVLIPPPMISKEAPRKKLSNQCSPAIFEYVSSMKQHTNPDIKDKWLDAYRIRKDQIAILGYKFQESDEQFDSRTRIQIRREALKWWKNGLGGYMKKQVEIRERERDKRKKKVAKKKKKKITIPENQDKDINDLLEEAFYVPTIHQAENDKIQDEYMEELKQNNIKEYNNKQKNQTINELQYVIGTHNMDVTEVHGHVYASSLIQNEREDHRVYQYNFFNGRDSNGKVYHTLIPAWVEYMFDPVYVQLVKWSAIVTAEEATGNKGEWVPIPKGNHKIKIEDNCDSLGVDNNHNNNQTDEAKEKYHVKLQELSTDVHTVYRQLHKNYCLGFAIAAGLHYMGFIKEAYLFSTVANELQYSTPNKALDTVKKVMKLLVPSIAGVHQFIKPSKEYSIDELLNKIDGNLRLVIPKGNDSDTTHVVTVIDDLIFDARCQYALKLNKKSLDLVCGPEGIDCIDTVLIFAETSNSEYPFPKRTSVKHW